MKRIPIVLFCLFIFLFVWGKGVAANLSLEKSYPSDHEMYQTCQGNVSLIFNQNIRLHNNLSVLLDGVVMNCRVDGRTLTVPYESLERGTDHLLVLKTDALVGTDKSTLNRQINIHFRTVSQPKVQVRKIPDFIVDGTEGKTFTDAIEAANKQTTKDRFIIFLRKKTDGYDIGFKDYGNIYMFHGMKPQYGAVLQKENVSIVGEDNGNTSVFHRSVREGISSTAVLVLDSTANHFYMQDVAVKNTMPFVGDPTRAVTIQEKSSHNIYKNVRLISGQDTYYTQNTKTYLEDCEVHGTIDYICGSGDVFFKNTLLCEGPWPGNMLTAHNGRYCRYGYVFDHCTVVGEQGFYYGRPWYNFCKTVFLHTRLIATPYQQGWNAPIHPAPDALLGEYDNRNSENVFYSARGKRLSASEAAAYTVENVLGYDDNWRPAQYTLQSPSPSDVRVTGSALQWKDSDKALYWAIVKDGNIIDFTTRNSYRLESQGKYSVRAANLMGGLGSASEEVAFK